ncbi:MAG: hypothetical protein JXA09_06125 [Anaerolineae bacterium]|nr:hypothetical protein [Anaerolineae bacterium]
MSKHVLSVRGTSTCLDGEPLTVIGLRCSNALISDRAADELIDHLDVFAEHGVNAFSVYWMGSRFGDVRGYRRDATLDPVYAARMARILDAADARAMVVLVGCLYWGNSRAKWAHWTQTEANRAVGVTVAWLAEGEYRHVFVDVDNEGMAQREAGFDNRQMLLAGKAIDPRCLMATNHRGRSPDEADLAIHFNDPSPHKPYVESEGSPGNVPGGSGYWGPYSNLRDGSYRYCHVGVYTPEMMDSQIARTRAHLDQGRGHMLASTWLQAPPPVGPNHRPGGSGSAADPGIAWWLAYLRETYGPYHARATGGAT